MTIFSSSLIGSIVGSGIVVTVAAFLNYRYSRKLEAFKWLHPERAKALAALSPLLSDLHLACVQTFVTQSWAIEGSDAALKATEVAFEVAQRKITELSTFVKEKGAFLDAKFVKQLGALLKEYVDVLGLDPKSTRDISPKASLRCLAVIDQ